jgi:hypothetical protein
MCTKLHVILNMYKKKLYTQFIKIQQTKVHQSYRIVKDNCKFEMLVFINTACVRLRKMMYL